MYDEVNLKYDFDAYEEEEFVEFDSPEESLDEFFSRNHYEESETAELSSNADWGDADEENNRITMTSNT